MSKLNRVVGAIKGKIKTYINFGAADAGKKTIVKIAGAAAGIIVCSVIALAVFTSGYEVYLDGEKIAVVSSRAVFEKAFESANDEIVSIYGKGFKITKIPKYIFTVAVKNQLTGEEQIKNNVIEKWDTENAAYVLAFNEAAEASAQPIQEEIADESVGEAAALETSEPAVGTGSFQQPFYGTITSRFGARWGRTHTGTDIAGEMGSPIEAADNGVVITAEYQDNGYGNIVIIDHQNGIHTWYAHLNAINVAEGAVVEKGTVIGELGSTGYSTGPHLHFEVRENGTPVDPAGYLEYLQ